MNLVESTLMKVDRSHQKFRKEKKKTDQVTKTLKSLIITVEVILELL